MSEKMDNTRAYASRFGGLILFVLAILVVGLLIYFTVRSAGDAAVNDDDLPAPEISEQVAEDSEDEPAAGPQTEDEAASMAEDDDEAEQPQVPERSVAGAASTDLPNTGPESVLLGALAVGGLIYAGRSYAESRKLLRSAAGNSR